MTDIAHLRAAVVGLIGFAAVEEEMLLVEVAGSQREEGSPRRWAALPLIAHNTDFKAEQVRRLEAVRRREVPPPGTEVDHLSDDLYRRYSELTLPQVAEASRRTTEALLDSVAAVPDDHLADPSPNPWLAGRALWLQVVVRGFWHPTGHLGEYYLSHALSERAVAMQAQLVAACRYLGAPDPARGMACYNLACAQARVGVPDDAVVTLREATGLNPALTVNAARDADLAPLRESGRLAWLLPQP